MPNGITGLGSYLPGAALGAGIGQTIGGLRGEDYSDAIRRAQQFYGTGMERATEQLAEREAIGREDIQQALQQAQQYGVPYREAGEAALQPYLGTLGIGDTATRRAAQEAFQASPGYQFALQEGLRGIQRGLAPRGLLGSGREARELGRYATGLAGQEYGRWQQQLAGLAGAGQTAAAQEAQRAYQTGPQLAQLGYGYGGTLANLYGQMAQAQAEAELARAQAQQQREQERGAGIGGLLGGLGTIGGTLVGGPVGGAVGGTLGGLLGGLF
jgi:hypothetical protein